MVCHARCAAAMMNLTLNCAVTRARLRLLQVAYRAKYILGELGEEALLILARSVQDRVPEADLDIRTDLGYDVLRL